MSGIRTQRADGQTWYCLADFSRKAGYHSTSAVGSSMARQGTSARKFAVDHVSATFATLEAIEGHLQATQSRPSNAAMIDNARKLAASLRRKEGKAAAMTRLWESEAEREPNPAPRDRRLITTREYAAAWRARLDGMATGDVWDIALAMRGGATA